MPAVSNASRRAVLTGLAGTVAGCAVTPTVPVTGFEPRRISPILMTPERIIRITVCTRGFRPTGPRLDVEPVGETRVVHNYGHGGSGWSLSWGSSAIAARKAMALAGLAGGPPNIAVLGSGALGLTSALQLQRMGARVTIYARDRAAFTRSMRATGSWTPDSRVADADRISADFQPLWEQMARETYATHQTYLGTEGDSVVFSDRYYLSGEADLPRPPAPLPIRTGLGVKPIRFFEARLNGLTPRSFPLPASASPFAVGETRMGSSLQFNVTELAHRLETEFLTHGGRIETRTFNAPSELTTLPEKIVINCTGYGARALFGDKDLTPVRGQIAWLAPQPEANYGLHFRGVTVLSRPDGIVVQNTRNDMNGVGLDDETPDREEAEATIGLVAPLFPSIRRLPTG
ncbi:FAD-dependent oxidoreductase [Brevundimonas sp.]|jgi:glycine/D-amino acid oxidase-like deaminating enzyme|uniref:FAD-dependent oxidoreductase n=1 Tax=Brevundimonas sp. TaxID=1871086 RepID=UPI0037C0A63F